MQQNTYDDRLISCNGSENCEITLLWPRPENTPSEVSATIRRIDHSCRNYVMLTLQIGDTFVHGHMTESQYATLGLDIPASTVESFADLQIGVAIQVRLLIAECTAGNSHTM